MDGASVEQLAPTFLIPSIELALEVQAGRQSVAKSFIGKDEAVKGFMADGSKPSHPFRAKVLP